MSSRAATRYAQAILQKANENDTQAVLFGDMQSVYGTIQNSRELQAVLQSPVIKAHDKREALLKIFSGQSDITHSLINLLIENKRAPLLGAVASTFIDLYNEQQGVKIATATTAVPLSSELEKKIINKVKELTGSEKVVLNSEVNPNIIGGFILRVGDIQYDASIANQFRNLRREFKNQYN